MENKPFVFGVATSGDNFTDRKKETARLLSNFRHGVNTVLISPRRWGKTSLVRKVCRLAQSDTLKVVYLDIFSCRSEREFYDAFASSIAGNNKPLYDYLFAYNGDQMAQELNMQSKHSIEKQTAHYERRK